MNLSPYSSPPGTRYGRTWKKHYNNSTHTWNHVVQNFVYVARAREYFAITFFRIRFDLQRPGEGLKTRNIEIGFQETRFVAIAMVRGRVSIVFSVIGFSFMRS